MKTLCTVGALTVDWWGLDSWLFCFDRYVDESWRLDLGPIALYWNPCQ